MGPSCASTWGWLAGQTEFQGTLCKVMDHLIGDEENIQFVGLFLDGLSPQVQKADQEPVLYT